MRYVLLVAYDGTAYCGWQVQANGDTIQQNLQSALYRAFGKETIVTASGRTDSGVHAEGQVCHFDCNLTIPPERIAGAVNCFLPSDIAVLKSAAAPDGFDANRSAKKKTYCYRFYCSPTRSPLMDRYALLLKTLPDMEALNAAAKIFEGEHDFKAYCASRSRVKTTTRSVYKSEFKREVSPFGEYITYEVCGGGFLYNMVRTMAGTCLGCAVGKVSKDDIFLSLQNADRALVGKTLPPNGLTLHSVDYGIDLFK